MSQFLLDTDTLSLLEHGNATVLRRINSHPVADIAITAISILEQMKGWQAVLNRARTRQQSDFGRVPGLTIDDWSV